MLIVLSSVGDKSTILINFRVLSTDLTNILSGLLEESSQFNTNDVLVNASEENKKLFFAENGLSYPIDQFPKGILKEAKKNIKESGVNTLCLSTGIVHLEKNKTAVKTPILLFPVSYKTDKVNQTVSFSYEESLGFLNPFVEFHLKNELQLDTEELQSNDIDAVIDQIQSFGLNVARGTNEIIGNFHHHRFQIVKELEDLTKVENSSANIVSLFGLEKEEKFELTLPNDNLLEADSDHEKVFDKVQQNNTVIQGPPGTGKSQVLTNVLAKLTASKNSSIVVSEKRVALEVLVKKLSLFGLDKFCFIASSDHLNHSFLQELKSTWDYFDNYNLTEVNNLKLSEQYVDNLQMTLDLLAQKKLIGGVSFHQFKSLTKDQNLDSFPYSSEVLFIDQYLAQKNIVKKVFEEDLFSSLGKLKFETLKSEKLSQFDVQLSAWLEELNQLSKTLNFSKWEDFSFLQKEAAICQVFENDLFKKYSSIFKLNSTAQKKFLSLRKRLLKSKKQLLAIQKNQSQWKERPSESETNSLLKRLENNSGLSKIFSRIKIKKRWLELSNLPFSEALKELQTHQENLHVINEYSQITIKFCELGVEESETEVPLIYQTIKAYSEEEWKKIASYSTERKEQLTSSHKIISKLKSDLKAAFNFKNSDEIIECLVQLKNDLPKVIASKSDFQTLSQNTLKSFSRNNSIEQFEGELFHSHWTLFSDKFPAFSALKMEDIKEKVNSIILLQKEESKAFAKSIENQLFKTFKKYNDLLLIPARKLNEKDKAKKVRLRRGKAILIKEFSKTRSHPSLRELFHSDAREWIQLLKPIWLSNPTQLAKCFPMEKDLFDVAIFDEASQIPLQNSLGTIYRSKRIVVTGDEFQMGPSSYFTSSNSEITDLLHQANYHWEKSNLKHHYRSVHPDLISFSNEHFYNRELKAYPAFNSSSPIHHYYSPDGTFIDRKNEVESKNIATELERLLPTGANIGIVAFSQEQKNCIWENLSQNSQTILSQNLQENRGFFKSLENVQGDECDELFISFGYAKDENGNFNHRFGPMNSISGRNRLNVLLTRAKNQIHFFCSIKSSDFKLSENESINLMKKWVVRSENYKESKELIFPFNLRPVVNENTLVFEEIQTKLPEVIELVILQRVLSNRGWNVEYA